VSDGLEPQQQSWMHTLVHVVIISTLALGMFTFQLGKADWEDDSESCGGQIVQEILHGDSWVLPLRNQRHIIVKPPLFYWLGALSARLRHSGGDRFDTRLPSAVLGTLCALMVYLFARRVATPAVGLWSALILITSSQFMIEARNSRVDIALCFFLTAALLLAHRVCEGELGRRAAMLAALALGLATLSKGPLALGLAVLVLGTTAVLLPPAPGWQALIAPASLALALGIPLLWYAAATFQQGMAFLRVQIYDENIGNVLWARGHFPMWFYIEPFFVGSIPWTLGLPWVVMGESAVPQRSRRFLWVWIVAMLAFFTVAPLKRRAYLLLVRPALSILLAGWLAPQLARLRAVTAAPASTSPRALHVTAASLTLAALVVIVLLRMGIGGFGSSETEWAYWWRRYFIEHPLTMLAFVMGLGVGIDLVLHWIWQRQFDLAAYALAGTLAVGLTIGVAAGAVVRGQGASFGEFAQRVAARIGPGEPLTLFDFDDESVIAFLFDLQRHVAVEAPVSPDRPCEPHGPGYYLVPERAWEARACFHGAQWQAVERGGPAADAQRWRRLVLARFVGGPS
jgi:4-amino-4-deoxy-L-arabinose transferase-like glycosyltransferase